MFCLKSSIAVLLLGALLSVPSLARTTKNQHRATTNTHKLSVSTHHSASKSSTAPSSHHGRGRHVGARASHKLHGQQAIAPERVTEIQEALIRAHYLNGTANGEWNSETIEAIQKLQADHGWQTKLMPDARAIKTLGLGPDYSGAINASGASFAPPAPVTTIPAPQVEGFTDAAGVKK